ncbi:ATP-dependent DNA helicase DinG [Sporosarcina sp. USHLN248]|uniref:ATP-dependent DNA helicase DinG n=1 Tax=Sporosarcina sp. USHLN248 TaxID=3081300 RepID=UPI00301AD9A0
MDNCTYAVVDLETTGHSPAKGDRIIQIAIVFIENETIIKKYARFVNPEREIPVFIQQLTAITDEEVKNAPRFEEIATSISEMLQGAVFVAHNTDFDLSFLQSEFKRCGVPQFIGKKVDTVELSKILFPTSHSYRLQDLSDELGIALPAAHRADDDAEATAHLLLAALKKLRTLPEETLNLLHRRSFSLRSDLSGLIYDALKEVRKKSIGVNRLPLFRGIPYRQPNWEETAEGRAVPYPIETEEKIALLKKAFLAYEHREAQLSFMDTVFQSLTKSKEVVAEVPTGVGKTIGYLLPAALHALQTGKPVIISTFTNHLVDKIMNDELEKVRKMIGYRVNGTVLKGREQYISLGKFEELLQITDESFDETFTIMQILVWLTETKTGDVNELNVSGGGQLFIDRIRKGSNYLKDDERIVDYHLKMQEISIHSHIIITNHSMLLSDLNREKRVFRSFSGIILDEAHQFIHTAARANETVFSYTTWKYVMGQISSDTEGQLLYKILQLHERFCGNSRYIAHRLSSSFDRFSKQFDRIATVLTTHKHSSANGKSGNRIVFSLSEVEEERRTFSLLSEALSEHITNAHSISDDLAIHLNQMSEKEKAFVAEWNYWIRELTIKAGEWVEIFLDNDNENFTVYIEQDKRSLPGSLTVVKSPVDTSILLKDFMEHIREESVGVIWTSGTMKIEQDERFVVRQLGIDDEVPLLTFDAPKHFYSQSTIFIVEDMPSIQQVSQNDYIEAVADAVVQTVIATGGRLFVLFTSQDMLRKTYELIMESELLDDYALIAQGVSSGSRLKLLKSFRQFEKSVLFGTNSFWEGVDVPGETLSAVIIVRLPFSSPEDVVFKAQADRLTKLGKNSFTDLALPEAILRLRQGFGRLIRSSEDRGFFIILDRRIETKSYGKRFIDALPNVPVKKLSLQHMVNELEACYNGEELRGKLDGKEQ